jgi:two-component system CheB/CheR fusion protein
MGQIGDGADSKLQADARPGTDDIAVTVPGPAWQYNVAPDDPIPGQLPFLTVAIGASAGGLHAFTAFLAAVPLNSGMAFVLIQHLDPVHQSLLVDLLASRTAMRVIEAEDGMMLAPDHVFVIPPDATMTVSGGRLRVVHPAPDRAHRWPIDTFFASLAADQLDHAVCIVLSGTGSDGSRRLAKVRQAGDLVLAQAASHGRPLAGMPRSAAATGYVDEVMRVEAMPARLLAHRIRHSEPGPGAPAADRAAEIGAPTDADQDPGPSAFATVCAMLRARTGHDFAQYKRPTLLRRIRHRVLALGLHDVDALIARLRHDPAEIDLLFRDLLIGVTQFMRDPAEFQFVRDTVLPGLLTGRAPNEAIRIWVPGCASGEEVYTLAILLREAMERLQVVCKVQIFGTDIDETAIARARAARYKAATLARLEPEQRVRWFNQEGADWRVVGAIREMCVFSVHNVVGDPPFSRLDLISCRNLLIYFNAQLQAEALAAFRYALRPGGWLFLGPSEGVARHAGAFRQPDGRHRVFQRFEGAGLPVVRRAMQAAGGAGRLPAGLEDVVDHLARRALEPYAPAYVVVDHAEEIVRFSGGAFGRFLGPSSGAASLNLFAILRKPLSRAVRSALQTAAATRQAVVRPALLLSLDGELNAMRLIVQPIADTRGGRDLFVVAFDDGGSACPAGPRAETVREDQQAIAQELADTRSELVTTITGLESANEELTSFNEEYQSTNEELQSTNEELETAKEEMQSVNEELETVNRELMARNEQLAKVNSDFENLLDSTQIATMFVDPDLRIRRFTPAMKALFRLRDTDLDRPLTDIATRLDYHDLTSDLQRVLTHSETVERDVELTGGGATFLMRMRPYRTSDRVAEGAVITFVDISDQKRLAEAQLLATLNEALEARVAERTSALEAASRELTRQTEQRRQAEDMLRQSQKLEAVGKLTGGIAHDFNNLLGAIIGNVEFLMDAVQDDPARLEQAREILDSALRGADLTNRLLAFASKQALNPRVVALDRLLPQQVGMLRRTLGETIEVTLTLAPGLWPTCVDPPQIGEALLNLALNARDAMPRGGMLSIVLSNVAVDAATALMIGDISAGDYVVLSVADSGTGMTQAVIEHATEPFFSTKPAALGSGLGLSIVYGFVRQSGGCLRIDSVVGRGTTVRLYLPRAATLAAPAVHAPPADRANLRGHEAILLVDDNPILRSVTERHLMALGYGVTVADSGPAALRLLGGNQPFDLLFTDILMPEGMTGDRLAEAARRLKPGLRVLFTTGYAGNVLADDGGPDHPPVLRKPYRLHAMATAVRAALDGSEGHHSRRPLILRD